jgi:hypothetical protein
VRDDEREPTDPLSSLITRENILNITRVRNAFDAIVQLAKKANSLHRARLANAIRPLQEEVVSRICRSDRTVVKHREVTDAGENEVLEDRGRCCARAEHEHARSLERTLAGGCP